MQQFVTMIVEKNQITQAERYKKMLLFQYIFCDSFFGLKALQDYDLLLNLFFLQAAPARVVDNRENSHRTNTERLTEEECYPPIFSNHQP